ncbi:amino acid permease [Proteus mirabilis]|uniref:Amino acid permease n=1 Tax=Proteus mirabilis TaxID=584 RepID=A0ABD5M122_PROMI
MFYLDGQKIKKDVGKATLLGFLLALIIYILLSVLPFGVMPQSQLAQLSNPSTAGVLAKVVGNWGDWLMNVGLIISVLAGWLAWTMLCAEIPMVAGQKARFLKLLLVLIKIKPPIPHSGSVVLSCKPRCY